MRGGVLAHLDANPAPAHLVCHGGGGAGAEKAVEDEVVGVGCDVEDALDQPFWLWRCKYICRIEYNDFLFCFLRMTYIVI